MQNYYRSEMDPKNYSVCEDQLIHCECLVQDTTTLDMAEQLGIEMDGKLWVDITFDPSEIKMLMVGSVLTPDNPKKKAVALTLVYFKGESMMDCIEINIPYDVMNALWHDSRSKPTHAIYKLK
jgi:hypothetical protein